MKKLTSTLTITILWVSSGVWAQADQFHPGQAIPEYGQIAAVPGMQPLAKDSRFKISFDVAKPAVLGEVNRSLDSVARFINMHVAAGVVEENIQLAVVIHGGAVKDMTQQSSDQASSVTSHDKLIKALQEKGVEFFVCGQSAAYYGVKTEDLLPGVAMSLSAMTAHALLQQQGYSLNPF